MRSPVVALDGGAGTGKSTIARKIARKLGWHCLNSGIYYRAAGLACDQRDIYCDNPTAAIAVVENLNIRIEGNVVWLNGKDVTDSIHSDFCGKLASGFAKIPGVREALLPFQLEQRQEPGLVAEGRDQCKLFFENPPTYLFFLITDLETRVTRRVLQFRDQGQTVDPNKIRAEILRRDEEDRTRSVDPLIPHPQARIIDTTDRTPDELANRIIELYRNH